MSDSVSVLDLGLEGSDSDSLNITGSLPTRHQLHQRPLPAAGRLRGLDHVTLLPWECHDHDPRDRRRPCSDA